MTPAPRWTIGFLSLALKGYFFGNLLGGVADAARRGNCRVVAIQTNDAGQRVETVTEDPFRLPVAWEHLDAFVVVVNAVPDSDLRALHATGKPLVLIAQDAPGFSCPVVVSDNAAGIAASIEHLVEHGHQRIAFVGRVPDASDDRLRLEAYRAEMAARGLPAYRPATVPWAAMASSARDAARQLLAEPVRPTAVVVSTDVTAIMLIEALHEQGVEVPRDMAVIGFDDIDDAVTSQPPLSTVAQSFPVTGSTAAQLAMRALDGERIEPRNHCAPVSFVRRESCGCSGPNLPPSAAAATGLAGRFASDLTAAVYEGRHVFERSSGVTGIDEGGPTQQRLRELSALAGEIVELFDRAFADADLDLTSAVDAIGATVHRLVPHDRTVLRIADLIREYARALTRRREDVDVDTVARIDDLSYRLSICAIERNMSSRPAEFLYFQQQREHYEYSTALLRRHGNESHSLAWLARTRARVACLALWEGGTAEDAPRDRLVVTDSYDQTRGTVPQVIGVTCVPTAFPPAQLLAAVDRRPGDIMYLLSVRFEGSEWGMLAIVGPLELREQASLDMINYWSVLRCVVLDQNRAVQSLVRQREDLEVAYERERLLREEIRISEERYALAADASNDGLWDWNLGDDTAYFSPRWKMLLGHPDHAIGTDPQEWLGRVHPQDRHAIDRAVAQQTAGETTTMEIEHRVRAADGSYRWMLTRARPVHDARGRVVRLVGSMIDINDRKLLEERLRRDALYDALTGLPNRTLFLERLNQAIELAKHHRGHGFVVVFLDLNGFKAINDTLGHQVGDQLLVHVANQLTGQMRADDTAARYGGDEFVVLLNDISVPAHVNALVDRLLAAIATPMRLDVGTVAVSACAGIATSPATMDVDCTAEAFVRDADTAMYRAKAANSNGGDEVVRT